MSRDRLEGDDLIAARIDELHTTVCALVEEIGRVADALEAANAARASNTHEKGEPR